MKTHVEIGYELVRYSQQDILKFAASDSAINIMKSGMVTVTLMVLKVKRLILVGRLASLADVFDALST